jgi:hypothetical protein
MRRSRRWIRRCFASILGLRNEVELWWTPQLPIVYVNNPKCGCSTVKNSLKQAQASRYRREGRQSFELLNDPHVADDCLKQRGVTDLMGRQSRLVISCARNPYARVLSAYLDKVESGDITQYRELGGRRPKSFEAFLDVLAATEPGSLDPHFSPQHNNLGLPDVVYDAIFYLENAGSLQRALQRALGDFELETFAPHSRRAQERMQAFYTPRTIDLVQRIYASDFAWLGYSRDIARATEAPGEYWTPRGIVFRERETCLRPASGLESLKSAIRYRHLIEARFI